MSIAYKTPASFSSFSCLGADCEDTCCRNWEVKLDRKHFDLLKKVMSEDEHEKSIFEQYLRFNENSITSDHDYAFIRMGVNGYCAMLDDSGLCSLHAKHGVDVLGDVCTMFPRFISRCGDTFELSGALSCPEVVRKCINDPSPLKLTRFKTSDLPRSKNYPIQRELSGLEDDDYSAYFAIVRQHFMDLMANESLALNTRLYAVANMAKKISSFYHRGCSKLDQQQLESTLSSLSEADFISKLENNINDYDAGSPLNMIVVHSILSIKLNQASDENISQLYSNIINSYGTADETNAEVLSAALVKVKDQLGDNVIGLIDRAVTRYIINCLYREWFISMPDSFTYMQMLLVRVAILRTLIYFYLAMKNEHGEHAVNENIVYVMYNFARNIDQNLEFLKVVYNALSEQTMMTFDFTPAFIRIY